MSAEEVGAERGVLGVYPDGGRSIWLLGMLITFKAVGEETGGEYSVFEQTVPPRAGVPPHIHHQESEAFYVLEGEFDLLTGGQAMRAGVGEFVLVPRAVVHSFTNPGTMPARYLAIVTPGGLHEKYLSESGQPAETETLPAPPEGPPDVERLRQIAWRYHTEMQAPPGQ